MINSTNHSPNKWKWTFLCCGDMRCSNKKIPCQVPNNRLLFLTLIVKLVFVKDVLICAGMSSFPSRLCLYRLLSIGTSLLKYTFRSSTTSGDAFSWIINEALVCKILKFSNPFFIELEWRTERTLSVISYRFWLLVLTVIVSRVCNNFL